MRSEQESVHQQLLSIRVQSFKKMNVEEKLATKANLKAVQSHLLSLKKKINSLRDKNFQEGSSPKWQDAVQQSRALQSWNEEEVIDLEESIRKGIH